MSEHNWKPGAFQLFVDAKARRFTWRKPDEVVCGPPSTATFNYRPLVVIDPEDREQIARLADAFCTARWSHIAGSDECDPLTRTSMETALREFANPTPPKPEEPTGLGAVVEDVNGLRWIRIDVHTDCNDWTDLGANEYVPDGENKTVRHFYRNIAAVRVLSEGVTT